MSKNKLHPLNKGFTWPDQVGPFKQISETQAAAWNSEGYFLYENAFQSPLLKELIEAFDSFDSQTEAFLEDNGGQFGISRANQLTFTTHLVEKSALAKAFTVDPIFAGLCSDLLDDDARLYWDQIVYKKPGNPEEFPWHQDNGYSFVTPQNYLTCWVALTDATIDNGCPWVMPGVHKNGTLKHWLTDLGFQCLKDSEGAVPVEAKAGDIVVFSSLTPHRTGPNLTMDTRKAYICQYGYDEAQVITREGEHIKQKSPQRQYRVRQPS